MEKKKMSFEEALARLDEIIGSMENGKAELDELLSLFEEGISLVKLCSNKLNAAERKIKLVKANGDEVPFKEDAEE